MDIYMDGMGYASWVPELFGPLLKGLGFTNSYPLADLFLRCFFSSFCGFKLQAMGGIPSFTWTSCTTKNANMVASNDNMKSQNE